MPDRVAREPFLGPRPFDREDHDLFFGRDREANEVVSLIIAHRVVLLYSQSGAGKTSLVNARIVPSLEHEGFEILPISRVRGLIPEDIRPQDIRNVYVFNALLSWAGGEADPRQITQASLSGYLRERDHPTDEEGLPSPRVVIFDQFEELFTFYLERWGDREDFFRQVEEALAEDPLLRVVFIVREDYLAQMDPYASLLPEGLRTRFRLEPLGEAAALSAVKEPLRDTNRTWAKGVAESLVRDLLRVRAQVAPEETLDVVGQFVEPVQLQVVCHGLWRELPSDVSVIEHGHLQTFGDVGQALSRFYESSLETAVAQSGVPEGRLRAWFNDTLITPARTRGTVFRGSRDTGGIPNSTVDILERLHIIRGEWRAGSRWYELNHDRFIDPIIDSNDAHRQQVLRRRRTRLTIGLAAAAVAVAIAGVVAGLRPFAGTGPAEEVTVSLHVDDSRPSLEMKLDERTKSESPFAEVTGLGYYCGEDTEAIATVDYGDGSEVRRLTSDPGPTDERIYRLSHVYEKEGDYTVTFTVTESGGDSFSEEASISVIEVPEVAGSAALVGHEDAVGAVAFGPDGRRLATGSWDNTARLWDVSDPVAAPEAVVLRGHDDWVTAVAFSPDGRRLATGSYDKTARLWNVNNPTADHVPLEEHRGPVTAVAFSPNGRWLATGSADKTACLWDVNDPDAEPAVLRGHGQYVTAVAFSPDGRWLATGSADNTARLWDVSDPDAEPIVLEGHDDLVRVVAFSPDGRWLATGSHDGAARLWDVDNLDAEPVVLQNHNDWLLAMGFSADSRWLVTGGADGTAVLRDLNDPAAEPVVLRGHDDRVTAVAFDPDGRWLATGSRDGTVRGWDPTSAYQVARMTHDAPVLAIAFSPDGDRLVTGSEDETAHVWDVSEVDVGSE